MRKITATALATAAVAATVVGFTASPAAAAGTWTVTPGGSASGSASGPTLTDLTTGTQLTCDSSTAAVTAKSGSGLAGDDIADITSIGFTNCSGPFGINFTVNASGLPWHLNAVSYDATTHVTTGNISGITASLAGATCTADIDGPGGAGSHTGSVNATYDNDTHVLAVSGGSLVPYNVGSGCLGLLGNGDPTSFDAAYAVTPAQTITSP